MTSWFAWLVVVAVAVALGTVATHFSVRTVRRFTAVVAIGLIVVVTTYGLNNARSLGMPASGAPDLETAFAHGADGITAALLHPLWIGHQVPEPGRVGWVIITVVLALGYRQLESLAYWRQAPVVDTSRLTDAQPSIADDGRPAGCAPVLTDGQRHDQLAAELKFRLAAMEMRSPAILPGGSRAGGLASIAEDSGVAGGALAGAVIQFLGSLWPGPRRWLLRVWVEPAMSGDQDGPSLDGTSINGAAPDGAAANSAAPNSAAPDGAAPGGATGAGAAAVKDGASSDSSARDSSAKNSSAKNTAATRKSPDDSGTRVTVELDNPRSGVTIATKTVAAASLDDVASMVAGYVTRQVFGSDPTAPPWCFGASDGRDLGVLLIARQERAYVAGWDAVRDSREEQIRVLATAAGSSRCAGIVRYELAQLLDLGRDHPAALLLHAINRDQYPRFFRGRYRLAMSLEMATNPGMTFRNPATVRPPMTDTLAIMRRCGLLPARAAGGDGDVVEPAGEDGQHRISGTLTMDLLTAARTELQFLRRQLTLPFVLWAGLTRRSERTVWRPHRHLRFRQSFRDGVCVAELLIAVRMVQADSGQRQAVPMAACRPGLRIVAAITGDSKPIEAFLAGREFTATASRPEPTRERARVLPWLRQTASWQAAYNAACIYSVLAQQGIDVEDRIITCLQRAIDNRDSEMERAYDWISSDPDFMPLQKKSPNGRFRAFNDFLSDQRCRDYPQPLAGRRPSPQEALTAAAGDQ